MSFNRNIGFLLSILCSLLVVEPAYSSEYGAFPAEPEVRLVGDREIILLKPFLFLDRKGREWKVPKNYKADGASIPSVFWSFVGGPLSGGYRDASIVHDYFCERKTIESSVVHKTFYDGMLARGVAERKAKIMYKAVSWFGPNWKRSENGVPNECVEGPNFRPTACVLNADVPTQDTTKPLTGATLAVFLSELEADGFAVEAEQIRGKAESQGIVLR